MRSFLLPALVVVLLAFLVNILLIRTLHTSQRVRAQNSIAQRAVRVSLAIGVSGHYHIQLLAQLLTLFLKRAHLLGESAYLRIQVIAQAARVLVLRLQQFQPADL